MLPGNAIVGVTKTHEYVSFQSYTNKFRFEVPSIPWIDVYHWKYIVSCIGCFQIKYFSQMSHYTRKTGATFRQTPLTSSGTLKCLNDVSEFYSKYARGRHFWKVARGGLVFHFVFGRRETMLAAHFQRDRLRPPLLPFCDVQCRLEILRLQYFIRFRNGAQRSEKEPALRATVPPLYVQLNSLSTYSKGVLGIQSDGWN